MMMALAAVAMLTMPAGADVFSDLASYKYGDETKAAEKLAELVKQTAPGQYAPIEAKLIAILKSKAATQDGKAFACRTLQQIGTDKAIPALATLLNDKILSHYARLALERMKRSPSSVVAMRNALATAPDSVKPGLMGSLAVRKDAEAVAAIAKLLGSSEKAVVAGALDSLGKIATPPAMTALSKAIVPDALKAKHTESLILCAATLGETATLHRIYAKCPSKAQKSAALAALVKLNDAKAADLVVAAVKSAPSTLREGAMQVIVSVPSSLLTAAVTAKLTTMPPATRAHVIELLGKRGDKAALPALVSACTKRDTEAVRTAAGKAVAELGGPEQVAMLLGLPGGPQIVKPMASAGVDDALIGLLNDKALKAAAISALGVRGARKAVAKLIALTGDADRNVRNNAWSALPGMASEADLPKLTAILVKLPDGPERDAASNAVRSLASEASNETKESVFRAFSEHYKAADTKMRQFVLGIGPVFATKQALALETAALNGENAAEKDKALRSLATWPNADPCPALLEMARNGKAKTQKILALRTYLDLAAKSGSSQQKLARNSKALPLIQRTEEKRLLISKLRDIQNVDSLAMAASYFDDATVVNEAKNAALDIIRRMRRGKDSDAIVATLKRIIESTKDKGIVRRAEEAMKKLAPKK